MIEVKEVKNLKIEMKPSSARETFSTEREIGKQILRRLHEAGG